MSVSKTCLSLVSVLYPLFVVSAFAQDNPLPRTTSVVVQGFKFEMKNCQKTSTKSITCYFSVTNQQADRVLGLYASYAGGTSHFVDGGGMQIVASKSQLGSASGGVASTETVTDIAVRASLDFGVGDPKATFLGKLSMLFICGDQHFRVEFRKIPLEGS